MFLCITEQFYNTVRNNNYELFTVIKYEDLQTKQFEILLCGSNGHKRSQLSLMVMGFTPN